MSEKAGIEIVPGFGAFLRQHTYLEKIDDIIDRDMVGCDGCEEYFNDMYFDYFGRKPELWANYDAASKKLGYGHLLAKLFVLYYLAIPQIPYEVKRSMRNLPLERARSFMNFDAFGIAKSLDQLLCAYAEKNGWKITDIVIPVSDIDNAEDDEEAHQKLKEYFPEWLRKAVGDKPLDFSCIDALYMIYEPTASMHLIIWESEDLYKLWVDISKFPRACTYEEMKVYNTFSILECIIFRENPMFQNGYIGNVVSHDRRTVAIYSIVGYEMIGDDAAYVSKMIRQAYVYRWSCIEILEWLRKSIRKMCEKN